MENVGYPQLSIIEVADKLVRWMSLFSYAYTNEMSFALLRASVQGSDPIVGTETQRQRSCSPRSMYSLATAVGIPYECIMLSPDLPGAWNQEHQGERTEGPSI